MNQTEIIANLEATAAKLCGRPVTVRIKAHPGAHGLIQKSLDGRAVMDLHPAIFQDMQLFTDTFTHEAAHIVKHFDALPRRDVDKSAALEIQKEGMLLKLAATRPTVKRHEDEAEALAKQWRRVVLDEYAGYIQACKIPLMAVLKILYHKTKEGKR